MERPFVPQSDRHSTRSIPRVRNFFLSPFLGRRLQYIFIYFICIIIILIHIYRLSATLTASLGLKETGQASKWCTTSHRSVMTCTEILHFLPRRSRHIVDSLPRVMVNGCALQHIETSVVQGEEALGRCHRFKLFANRYTYIYMYILYHIIFIIENPGAVPQPLFVLHPSHLTPACPAHPQLHLEAFSSTFWHPARSFGDHRTAFGSIAKQFFYPPGCLGRAPPTKAPPHSRWLAPPSRWHPLKCHPRRGDRSRAGRSAPPKPFIQVHISY